MRETGKISISEVFESVSGYNPISGHYWWKTGRSLGFEVSGGFLQPTFHKKMEKAQAAKDDMEAFVEKFPWTPPLSKREVMLQSRGY